MLKMITLAFFLLLCFTACTPRIGIGAGGVVASSEGITTTKVYADTQSGIHGSVSTGTDMGL